MKVVILGATGQLGSIIFQKLLKTFPTWQLIGTSRKNTNSKIGNIIGFDPFTSNWSILGHADILINCIGIINEHGDNTYKKLHIQLAEKMLQQRQNIGNPFIINISALGANSWSRSAFLSTKAIADNVLLKAGNCVIVRPSIVCTPGTMLVKKLRQLRNISRFTFGHIPAPEKMLSVKIQPVMPGDFTEIIARLCESASRPHIIQIAGPHAFTLKQLICFTDPVKIVSLKSPVFNKLVNLAAMLFPFIISREQLLLLQQNNTACTKHAEEILGRQLLTTEAFWPLQLKNNAAD